jgi:hypothetical protein
MYPHGVLFEANNWFCRPPEPAYPISPLPAEEGGGPPFFAAFFVAARICHAIRTKFDQLFLKEKN